MVSDNLSTLLPCILQAAPLPDPAPTLLPLHGQAWPHNLQHGTSAPRVRGWEQLVVPKGLCRVTWLCPKGWEVQLCSPSPSRGLGWHWAKHSAWVLIEEGALGFQECLGDSYSQTTASSEASYGKCCTWSVGGGAQSTEPGAEVPSHSPPPTRKGSFSPFPTNTCFAT